MIDVADRGEKSRVLSKETLAPSPLMTWQIPEQPHVKPLCHGRFFTTPQTIFVNKYGLHELNVKKRINLTSSAKYEILQVNADF